VSAPEPGARRQSAREARQSAIDAAIAEDARAEVATWPPLTEWQRDRLRVLLDLSGGTGDEPA
jgi:hypothetical protein